MGRLFLFLIFCLLSLQTWASGCLRPSVPEAAQFFRGERYWMLVDGPDTYLENQNREVIVSLDFQAHERSVVLWNGGPARIKGLQVCKNKSPGEMTLQSNWPNVTLTLLPGQLIRASALGIKFYLRPAKQVKIRN